MKSKLGLPPTDKRHGTYNAYINYGCRCEACTKANSDYVRERREKRKKMLEEDPSIVPHGRYSTYHNWSCRCQPCKNAWKEKYARDRKRK